MQRTRPFTTQRLYGMGFICIVLGMICYIHFTFVFLIWGPTWPNIDAVTILSLYHIFFGNLLLSFYNCIMTDPGVVPANWGFHMGDETKRRRYCKMCNVWKPDRSHHCSICNRCILNMDHHCPWINNCVGFYNRKFFMLLLFYVYMSVIFVVTTSIPVFYNKARLLLDDMSLLDWTYPVMATAYILAAMLLCTLTNFIKFHVKLILDNYTTIENLEREEGAKSKFDIGRRRNWEQIFGANQWLWWLPLHTRASRPIGDGVRWRVHYTRVIDEDEELPAEN